MNKRYQVFVSSTYTDLIEERKEATQAILRCNCFPAGMELFPASNKKQWHIIKQVIDDSDFYLLILAGRYGSLGTDDLGNKVGYTEMEFDYAVSKGKPIVAMLYRNLENLSAKLTEKTERNIKRLEKFREKAMDGRMVAFWENKDQLNGEIISSLHEMMSSTPEAVGWIRADVVIESNKTSSNSTTMIIEEQKEYNIQIEKYRYVSILQQKVDDALASFTNVLQTSDNESEQIRCLNDFIRRYCDVFYYYQQNEKILKPLKKYIDELVSTHEQIKSNQFREDNNEYIESLFRKIYKILQSIQNDCINHKI